MNTSKLNLPNAFLAIFWGGLLCGVFDITQAFTAWGLHGDSAGENPVPHC